MSVIFQLEQSVFLDQLGLTQKWYRLKGDHEEFLRASIPESFPAVIPVDHFSETTTHENITQVFTPKKVNGYQMKTELFAIESPFMMESQIERLKAAGDCSKTKETSADRKRRKKLQKALNSFQERKILSLVKTSMAAVILKARSENILSLEATLYERNDLARAAAALEGCGDIFQQLCDEFDEKLDLHRDHLADFILGSEIQYSAQNFIGTCVRNEFCKIVKIDENEFIIPDRTVFLTSSYDYFITKGYQHLLTPEGFELIVIDPPWKNKSVKRKKSYNTFNEEDLKRLPINELCKDNCFICVWVTNNEQFINFVQCELFPVWSVEWKADWLWMKVTKSGVPVCDVNSHHKKPYEHLIIGQYHSPSSVSLATALCDARDYSKQSVTDRLPVSSNEMNVMFVEKKVLESEKQMAVENNKTEDGIEVCCSMNSGEEENGRKTKSPSTLPNTFLIVSIPCSLHSKKPPLSEVFQPYLSKNPKCVELFARNLIPGWSSWGNEPLRHQHLDYFEPVLQ